MDTPQLWTSSFLENIASMALFSSYKNWTHIWSIANIVSASMAPQCLSSVFPTYTYICLRLQHILDQAI